MKVLFRTDASTQIGTGHVMRCLTLANGLAKQGATVSFICREHDGNLITFIRNNGFFVNSLAFVEPQSSPKVNKDFLVHESWLGCEWKEDADECYKLIDEPLDWIIVDHYALDYRWETVLSDKSRYLMCIDDLADRRHECDVLLDQNFGRKIDDYCDHVSKKTLMLLGPNFSLLRPEFATWRDVSLSRRTNPKLEHILISMGGVDQYDIYSRVLTLLKKISIPTLKKITVVLGSHAPHYTKVKSLSTEMPVRTNVLRCVDNMAELMTSCDLAIGAGGATTWERCCLGVPAIQIELAKNQKFINTKISKVDAAIACDLINLEEQLSDALRKLTKPSFLKHIASRAAAITNGSGLTATLNALEEF